MGERDAIADSDQRRSFRAFWDFLMSSSRQEELSILLERVLTLPPVIELKPDPYAAGALRLAGSRRAYAAHGGQLSQQLRRFLDDQAWLENRRIMDILRGIEAKRFGFADTPPAATMTHADMAADIELPMERPLYIPRSSQR